MARFSFAVALATLLGGCDFSGDFLFPGEVPGVPPVYVLIQDNGELFTPVDIASLDDVDANTIYAEVGPPVNSEPGGVTLDFIGTGGDVCVWVDPELVYFSESVAENPQSDFARKWSYPDNFYDDGDIDLFAGLSVYYTGSPGEQIGDFVVQYEDSLGNKVPISLSECTIPGGLPTAHTGRGMPEYCTISATDVGISYTVLLQTFSTPLDDDRLSYGVLLANGPCEDISALGGVFGASVSLTDECVIRGESVVPEEASDDDDDLFPGPWIGRENVNTWPGSVDYEERFCGDQRMGAFCRDEADAVDCEWSEIINPENRCYCGDERNSPSAGAF